VKTIFYHLIIAVVILYLRDGHIVTLEHGSFVWLDWQKNEIIITDNKLNKLLLHPFSGIQAIELKGIDTNEAKKFSGKKK